MQKVMILGAGIYQVPLIEKAISEGYFTIVVSPKGNYPGIQRADLYIDSDIRDKEYIFKYAREQSIDAIATCGSDVGVPTIGYINDRLGLSGVNFHTAEMCSNKLEMKKVLESAGINTARFRIVSNFEQAKAAVESIKMPLMVKAPDLSGSRGIFKVNTFDELELGFYEAKKLTQGDYIIIEEFLDGYEVGAELLACNREKLVIVHDRKNYTGKSDVPIGHSIPSVIDYEIQEKIKKLIIKAADFLGINNTVSNSDIMIVNGEPYIIEIGARMGATCIPENIEISYGIDIYKLILDLALGNDIDISKYELTKASVSQLLISNQSGTVNLIEFSDSDVSVLEQLNIDININDKVREFNIGPDRIGNVIASGESIHEAESKVNKFVSGLHIGLKVND